MHYQWQGYAIIDVIVKEVLSNALGEIIMSTNINTMVEITNLKKTIF
jgi:hypothetical protein